MSPVRDTLQRFRPAGTPGRAAAAAVPADRARDLAAELQPVFSMLSDAEAERTRILDEAAGDARRIREDARTQADDMVAAAWQRAQAVRADAAAAALTQAEADAEAALRAAERQAQVIREQAARLMPGYVSRAVQAVRTLAEHGHAQVKPGDDAGHTGRSDARDDGAGGQARTVIRRPP